MGNGFTISQEEQKKYSIEDYFDKELILLYKLKQCVKLEQHMKRSLVMQCVTFDTLPAPPTAESTFSAICLLSAIFLLLDAVISLSIFSFCLREV